MSIIKILLIGLCAVFGCMAQVMGITGMVTDTGNTIIIGAFVRLEKTGLSDSSESDGSFSLTDIATGISSRNNPAFSPKLSASIHDDLLSVDIMEKSDVEVITFDLNGKALSKVQRTMDAGANSLRMARREGGIYLYKVKSGANEILLKSTSVGGVSHGAMTASGPALPGALAKRAKVTASFNDVIAATKDGYLNYRVAITNSDTSNIRIKMIACPGTVTDFDGNVYQTVSIGNQVWTTENLRTTRYNDGTPIPLVSDTVAWVNLMTPGFCYYNNMSDKDSLIKWGALYNWYAADTKALAPAGWHVPVDAEWDTLQNFLMAKGYNWNGALTGNNTGKSLATKTDWYASTVAGAIGNDLTKNNRSGFSALPGGYRDHNGHYNGIGIYGLWWSASELDAINAYFRELNSITADFSRNSYFKSCGLSMRLVKD